MKHPTWLRISLSALLAVAALSGLMLPVAASIGGTEVNLSSLGGGSPDMEISGQFVAVTYFRKESDAQQGGVVYVKSATQAEGWLTSSLVGFGSNSKLAFDSGSTVYVVWARSDGKAIQASKCILSATTSPACTAGADVRTSATASLDFPDVVVDNNNFVHVAWENDGVIETARATAANSVGGWTVLAPAVGGGGNDHKPVLAWSNDKLHLAFLRSGTSIQYRGSAETPHSWGDGDEPYDLGSEVIGGDSHDRFDNLALTASGNNVFLAWDAHQGANDFSLIRANSVNNGTDWSDAAFYVPSGNNAINAPIDFKASQDSGVPAQEKGLQPSLAISGTNDAALVWQEIGGTGQCPPNRATTNLASFTSGAGDVLTNNSNANYLIDPDVVVAAGQFHFVYMRDLNVSGSCSGQIIDYQITYRGPFTKTTRDVGEGGGVYLPTIRKNS
ncbi:MAG: hypothetical protein BroJett011_55100 [Chloroflexota bacterium]|nr:MAG: hypothetical protein BroJett011_55100 [Chloroflexota bacterium]